MNDLKKLIGQGSLAVGFAIAAYGFVSIFYGYYTLHDGMQYPPLDACFGYLGFPLTLFATIVTVLSVYIPNNETEPWFLSKLISPFLILLLFGTVIEAWNYSRYPNDAVVNGIALIGLSGAILRTIPRPHENHDLNK